MISRLSFRPLLLAGWAALLSHSAAQAQAVPARPAKARLVVTTVYLVRHAEKDSTSDPADQTLSAAGQVRARVLRQLLVRRHPAALFTTDTRRTRATLAPLAEATRLMPQVYNPKEPNVLAARIREEYAGKTVVVVGHSNTLLPCIAALGGTLPVREIGDKEYRYLFTVRILNGGPSPTVAVRHYGAKPQLTAADKAARTH